MASEGGHTNDATARRRRIAEKGSDRLALITGGRAPNPPPTSAEASSLHSSNASLTDENMSEIGGSKVQPVSPSQDTRRKCSFFAGIVALLSYLGFPILGSYIIRSIILSRPLVLLLFINVSITVGPLLLDAMMLIQKELNNPREEADLPDNMGSPFEWGMLFKAGLSALFMDSCIYSVVVICATSLFQKFGL
ncbi:hypothetical protein HanXRQr2_Chr17g0790251 [Helianthus annuus]|uniref:Uncharacterized protein n=1 Tax=Helianthus annuus TaxID=4232 RepID=A0A9K3DF54_HELAN|nr:hypothetical protein HanXRQr2_Chr17g0790251 [Helianthus annuus]KAJ0812123.1 hypothetical protein HanPSC8_Chr17g0758361 [Helianthus annuus]